MGKGRISPRLQKALRASGTSTLVLCPSCREVVMRDAGLLYDMRYNTALLRVAIGGRHRCASPEAPHDA